MATYYHFINEAHGIQAIKSQSLKVSTLYNLNDPFELLAINLQTSSMFREAILNLKKDISLKTLILCFSKSYDSPLLWSHYADKHKGMALAFEINQEDIENITYQKNRIAINEKDFLNNNNKIKQLLTTKYSEWEYEQEARMFINYKDTIAKITKANTEYKIDEPCFYFYNFRNKIKLTAVILGALSKLNKSDIKKILPKNSTASIFKSNMDNEKFHITTKYDVF